MTSPSPAASSHLPAFGIGLVAGLRSMTAAAALVWAAHSGRTRAAWIPAGRRPLSLATAAALVEIIGDKTPFAPDRRVPASFLLRLALGAAGGAALAQSAAGGAALAGPGASRLGGALSGAAGAALGTWLGSAIRTAASPPASWAVAMIEDAAAIALAATVIQSLPDAASTGGTAAPPVSPAPAARGRALALETFPH